MQTIHTYHRTEIGQGSVSTDGAESIHLHLPAVTDKATRSYHDAQISTYHSRRDFHHTPPVHMHIRAHATGPIRGTAGFGLWNHPFAPNERGFRLPRAAWFFYGSQPNNMALAKNVPGFGWKCATIDATRAPFLALLPFAPLGFLLMRAPPLYRALWPLGQWALGVSEKALDESLLMESHDYTLDWQADGVRFGIDGVTVHHAPVRLRGPLGFIAWIDNQYAIVTPRGQIGFGLLDIPAAQNLVLESVTLQ